MNDAQRRSRAHGDVRERAVEGFELREIRTVAKVRVQILRSRGIRTHAADPQRLPHVPNSTAGADPIALWKAPDDWLVYSQTLGPEAIDQWVDTISAEAPLITTNVSSASVLLELKGPRAIEVLMRDCSLDLEGNAVPPGGCAQTLFAQTSIMIHRPHEAATWRMFVERSVARHVWDWLMETADPCSEMSTS